MTTAVDLLRLAARLGRFGAWTSDLGTGITTWSEELQGIHGCPWEGDCTNEQMLQLFAPESQPVLREAFAPCAMHGTPFDLELQVIDEHARLVWVRVIGVAKQDEAGRIAQIQGAYQDIDDSKRISESNRAWADRFRGTLDSLTDGFAILGRDWHVLYANRAALEFVSQPQGAIGRLYWDLFPGVRDTIFGEHYVAAMERRQAARFEEYYGPLDRWYRISVFPVDEGIVISFSDTSAAHREREQLVGLNAELERRVRERTGLLETVNEDLKAFSYAVAHDVRSPIGRVAGFAKELQHRAGHLLDERSRFFLARIRDNAEEVEATTVGLLTLFQVTRGKLERRRVDLAAIARDIAASLQDLSRHGQPAAFDIAASLPASGDPTLLATALRNLLDNAVKYSRKQEQPLVQFGGLEVEDERRYFVRDNGVGFDPASGGPSFRPLDRLHGREFEGSGIGLATVHKIVTLHGGRIWAESEVGRGATFWFTLGE